MNIRIPDEVQYIIDTLESGGFEAYIVGGCVRDSLMGKAPHDWDICTSALPEQTIRCFDGQHIVETGLRHGTIMIILNHKPFEVTTYRVDGKYTDNRRPDKVKFVNVLKRDLARRDFTINAIAYNPKTGLADYYDGQRDLSERKIKCVGNPNKRFQEDALRIMRALRFASIFGFEIESGTAKAMHDNRKLLKNIAAERIAIELSKLICGDSAGDVLSAHLSVLLEIIPELKQPEQQAEFNQNNSCDCYCYDVFTHIMKSVDVSPKDIVIRLTMLLHNQGSSDIVKKILLRLRYDSDTVKAVTQLVIYHKSEIRCVRQDIKRWLNKIGEERFRQLLDVKRADIMAQVGGICGNRLKDIDDSAAVLDEIISQKQCFSLKDLAVNGRDLINTGVPRGAKIGVVLNRLMNMVIDEEVENDKAILLNFVREIIKTERR